jgi:hypothetical protein
LISGGFSFFSIHFKKFFEFALFFIVIECLHHPSGGILAMSEDEDIFDSLTYRV